MEKVEKFYYPYNVLENMAMSRGVNRRWITSSAVIFTGSYYCIQILADNTKFSSIYDTTYTNINNTYYLTNSAGYPDRDANGIQRSYTQNTQSRSFINISGSLSQSNLYSGNTLYGNFTSISLNAGMVCLHELLYEVGN